MSAPEFGAYDLVCLSHLRWDWVYQRPQHLMKRWAQSQRVLFVEEPVFDSDTDRIQLSEREGVSVLVPHLCGYIARAEANKAQEKLLAGFLEDHEVDRYVLWYYTPMALDFTRQLEPVAVVYDCMDELSTFSEAPSELGAREAELLQRADLVFAGGQSLYEAKRVQHPSVHAFPSSVDVDHFALARAGQDEPEDQREIPHPRIGFYGVLDERLDTKLLARVVAARPDWHFVMIGPLAKIDRKRLPQADNVHYLGQKSYDDLPAYLAGWDAAMLPFALRDSTRYLSPTKIPEYLAAGRCVISTPIRDVVLTYASLDTVRFAISPDDWIAAIESMLANKPGLEPTDRLLGATSWDTTWGHMKAMVDGVIDYRADSLERGYTLSKRDTDFDYVIVGAGFAGSVLAERLASQAGKRVLVVERRSHIGGNAHDYYDEAGILVHKYGPHIFHTNSIRVFDYLSQFTAWRPYQHRVRAMVDGRLLPIPINLDTINELYGLSLSSLDVEKFFESVAEPVDEVRTAEDVVVSKVGRDLYQKFFRGYTRKQWGLDPSELDAGVTARVPTRTNRDDRYFTDTFQAMPLDGYTRMFERMLDHPNIKIMLNTDYREIDGLFSCESLVYTGPVDEYFDHRYGRLPYRSLEFKLQTIDSPTYQPYPVINYPNDYAYTRITEFKYLTGQEHSRTTIVAEYPRDDGDPYYPVPRPENAELYAKYRALAERLSHVYFVGRLATYKYYNMDQVVAQALSTFDRLSRNEDREHEIEVETVRAKAKTRSAPGSK